MGDLSENFSQSEFACPCCGRSRMDAVFIRKLQALRTEYGRPITIVDGGGYRCVDYDGKRGAHTQGRAIDPAISQADIYPFLALAFRRGFTGIGVKNRAGRFQVHVDDIEASPGRPRPWVWTY